MSLQAHSQLCLKGNGSQGLFLRTGKIKLRSHSCLQRNARRRILGTTGLTLIPGKVMEKIILETSSKHMKEKKAVRSSQHRFMKGKSCLTNLIAFYDGKPGLVNEGRAVDVIYLN